MSDCKHRFIENGNRCVYCGVSFSSLQEQTISGLVAELSTLRAKLAEAERPILFSAPMVRAILEDRKTETRRLVPAKATVGRMMSGNQRLWPFVYDRKGKSVPMACRYGEPGDRLWVKETFYCDDYRYPKIPEADRADVLERMMYYAADGDVATQIAECEGTPKLTPSIFMPRWASRITLEVVAVRVERLQAIREDGIRREGLAPDERGLWAWPGYPSGSNNPVYAYQLLWEMINGPRSWNNNPWVWVVTFKRL
jgi:hypothetical protein